MPLKGRSEPSRITLKVDSPQYFKGKYGQLEHLLYLSPGDSLTLEAKGTDYLSTLNFSGQGAKINNYLVDKKKTVRKWKSVTEEQLEPKDTLSFKKRIKVLRKELKALRTELRERSDDDIPRAFLEKEGKRDLIIWGRKKFLYPNRYRYETGNDTIDFSSEYWSFLENIPLDDPKNLYIPGFLEFSYSMAKRAALEENIPGERGKKTSTYPFVLFNSIEKKFSGRVKEALLTHFILKFGKKRERGESMDLITLWQQYRKTIENPALKRYVKKRILIPEDTHS